MCVPVWLRGRFVPFDLICQISFSFIVASLIQYPKIHRLYKKKLSRKTLRAPLSVMAAPDHKLVISGNVGSAKDKHFVALLPRILE